MPVRSSVFLDQVAGLRHPRLSPCHTER
jgi:hypothetical protein